MLREYIGKFRQVPWGKIAKDTLRATYQHDCTDAAAAMAFDFVFAIFPGLLVLTALMVIMGISPDAFKILLDDIGIIMPGALLEIVEDNIEHLWDSYQSLVLLVF